MANTTIGEFKDNLKESTDKLGVYWVDEELYLAFREAINYWQALIGCFGTSATIGVPTSYATRADKFLAVPKQIASLQRVSYAATSTSTPTPLTLSSVEELNDIYAGSGGWGAQSGTPLWWTPVGLDKFLVVPTPTSGRLLLEGISENYIVPDHRTSLLPVGDEELTYLLNYAIHYLSIKEGAPEMEATVGALRVMVDAALHENSRLKSYTPYYRAMGIFRDLPGRAPTQPEPTLGGR